MSPRRLTTVLTVVIALGLSACGTGEVSGEGASPSAAQGEMFPDVEKVEVSGSGDSVTFDVTMSSPYDSPERYADGMRVRSADGKTTYGERELTHDHASEQPFTRSVDDVEIPEGVNEVVVEGRDQQSGWGGGTKTVTLEQ